MTGGCWKRRRGGRRTMKRLRLLINRLFFCFVLFFTLGAVSYRRLRRPIDFTPTHTHTLELYCKTSLWV